MAGAAAGPIGAIIGALLGATASMLFKAAKPNAGAEFTFGADNSLTTTWTRDHAGGKSSTLVGLADQLPQSLTSLERILGVELGQFNFGMQNEHNRSLYIAGSDAKGRFYYDVSAMYDKKGRFQEEAVKQSLDKFVAAVLKRGTVLNQIDDELVRGAIASSNKLSEAQAKLKTVAKIEAYTGEKTSLGDTLTQARVDYEKWTAWVSANVRKSTRADELDKLTTAYLGKFSDAVAQFNDGLAQLTGATTDTIGAALRNIHSQFVSIRAQNRELAQAAKASGGKVSYTPLTDSELAAAEASAVGKARNDVLAYIRQLTGASQPLADQIDNVAEYFANVRDHANDLGISLDWLADQEAQAIATLKNAWANGVKDTINASARAVRDAIAGNDGTIARLTKDINAGMADIAQLDNQSSIESAIAKISSLIKQRYDLEISSISATISAAKGLRDYVGSLGSSDLSPYSPGEKLSLAGANYGEILLKAQAGDPNAASQLQGAFSSYLQLAASNYGTASAEYRSIFEGGKAALDQVSQNILTGAEARITNLTQSALALVDTLTAMAQTQIVAIQNNTAALAANTDALTGAAKDQVSALDAHGQLLQDMLNTPASPTPSASLLLAGWQK